MGASTPLPIRKRTGSVAQDDTGSKYGTIRSDAGPAAKMKL
jgi:hypothetical protein